LRCFLLFNCIYQIAPVFTTSNTWFLGPTKVSVIFHIFAQKPPVDGFASNLVLGRGRRRNNLWQFLAISWGGRICGGRISAVPTDQACRR